MKLTPNTVLETCHYWANVFGLWKTTGALFQLRNLENMRSAFHHQLLDDWIWDQLLQLLRSTGGILFFTVFNLQCNWQGQASRYSSDVEAHTCQLRATSETRPYPNLSKITNLKRWFRRKHPARQTVTKHNHASKSCWIGRGWLHMPKAGCCYYFTSEWQLSPVRQNTNSTLNRQPAEVSWCHSRYSGSIQLKHAKQICPSGSERNKTFI